MNKEIRLVAFLDFDTINRLQAAGFRFVHELDRNEGLDRLAFVPMPDGPHWILSRYPARKN
jgi:hypothetical protein